MKTILHLKKTIIILILFLFASNVWGQPSAQDVITNLNSQIGQCIDMDNAYGCQCVDLAKYVCITYWGQNIVGNANQLDELNRWPAGTIKINYSAGFIPQQGDFYIWGNYGTNGHIGLINTANATSYTSLDENFVNPSSNGSPLANVNHSNYNNVTCFMRLPYSICPSIPNTTTPLNAQTNVGIPVFFNWDDVSGTNPQYRIQVSTSSSGWTASSGFTTTLVPTGNIKVNVNTNDISQYSWSQYVSTDNPFTPQPNTTYYYTVKSFACGQSSNYSTIKSFTTGCLATTPVLLSPTNGLSNVTNPVNFDWQDDSGTNPLYRIQVSTVNTGWTIQDGFTANSSPIGNVVVNQNTNNVSAYQWNGGQSGTTYYWTVRTNSCNHSSPYSPVRSFTIGNITPCNPPTVTLSTPANGVTYNVGQTISLQWIGAENGCAIQDYQIEITAPNGNSTSQTQTSTSFNFTATTAGIGTWQWRVRARNINGTWGNYTSSRTFIISQTTTSYSILTSSNPAIGGTTSGNGTYLNGSNVTATATANSGYIFSNWTENNTIVSTNATYSFIISSNRNLVANFSIPNTGQGCVGGTQFPSFTLNPTNTWQVQNTIFAGEYAVFNVVNNQTYTWSLCEADGGYTNYDSQLTLRNNSNGNYINYSDDFCGTNAKITWTSYFDGQVRVLVNQYNCSSNTNATTLAYKSENTLNITEIENKLDFKVYPNPTEDIINIDSKKNIISKIEIIDFQGRLIFKDNYNNTKIEINTSPFVNGTYLLKIFFENEQQTYKIIKN